MVKKTKLIYSNDRKAPRMRKAKYSKRVICKELYEKFKEGFPEYKAMTWAEFYQNWADITETIRVEAIINPWGVKLGSYTGEIKLQYLPYKKQAENFPLSEELGERTFDPQIATKGKTPKIKWERRQAVKFNTMLNYYGFNETRQMTDLAIDHIREHPEKILLSKSTKKSM